MCSVSRAESVVPLQKSSEAVFRATWRIAEYILRDFVDYWFVKVSDNKDFPNDVREMLEYAVSMLASRSVRIDWPMFISKNVIGTFKDMLRLFRFAERDCVAADPSKLSVSLLRDCLSSF